MAAIPLAYILPGLAFIQLEAHSLFSREKLPALGLVIFGVLVTISGISVQLPNLFSECSTGSVMGYCETETVANTSAKAIVSDICTPAPTTTKLIMRM